MPAEAHYMPRIIFSSSLWVQRNIIVYIINNTTHNVTLQIRPERFATKISLMSSEKMTRDESRELNVSTLKIS